jgi:hypothetical protein
MVNQDSKEKMMNKKTLHPDELMKLYPTEEISKMSSEQVDVILRSFMASLGEHSIEDKEETIKEMTNILDDCLKRKKRELLNYLKNKGKNNE